MTGNKLKIIACISMLIDHIGYVLFPKLLIFRYFGRLAMPLFAFLIGEGCIHTRHKTRYFLQLFSLGFVCQAVQIGERLMHGKLRLLFLNILLTFSIAVLLCFALLRLKEKRSFGNVLLVVAALGFAVFVCFFLGDLLPVKFDLDYNIFGILLPASVVLFDTKQTKVISFFIGLLMYCLYTFRQMSFVWFALLAIPLLFLYNGRRGTAKLKYAFYIFYPAHIAALYLIDSLFF